MNYFKFSKLAIATTICFFVTALLIMLTEWFWFLIIPSLVCLIAGLVCLAVIFMKRYKTKKQEMLFNQEEIIMELSQTEDGEKYVAEKSTYAKRLKKKIKSEKARLIAPFIIDVALIVMFFALLVKSIITLF